MGGEFGREWIHVLDGYIYGYKWMNTYMYGWVSSLFTWNYCNVACYLVIPQYKIKSGKNTPSNAGDLCLIPGQRTKISRVAGQLSQNTKTRESPHATMKTQSSQKKKELRIWTQMCRQTEPMWRWRQRCGWCVYKPRDARLPVNPQDPQERVQRNQVCWHLDLRLAASRAMSKYISVIQAPPPQSVILGHRSSEKCTEKLNF